MAFNINRNHPSLVLSSKVSEVGKEFIQHHNLRYFTYLRCYEDGKITSLANDSALYLYFFEFETRIFTSAPEDNAQTYIYLWDELADRSTLLDYSKEKLNMHHGMTIVRRHKHYYDLFAFALPEAKPNALSYYLSHLKQFEQFSNDFLHKGSDLIHTVENQKVLLPPHMQDQHLSKICLGDKPLRHEVIGKQGSTYITSQEFSCLQFLSQGKSYKEAASLLSISPRTFETYLNRMKTRTGFSGRKELFDLLSVCG